MKASDRAEFFSRLQELNPHPKTELLYNSTFELLLAVMLSAQSTDIGVNKVTRRLFPKANTPEAILKLGLPALRKAISSLGLYNAKAANVYATCELLISRHNGEVPAERTALEALPGVGRKTANVVLNTAFGEPTMAVDTHVFRLANRTGLAPGKTVRQVEDKLMKVIPKPFLVNAHHWLILHGRYVCKARSPDCPNCVVRDLCSFTNKTSATADS
jgi:endonuclease-3